MLMKRSEVFNSDRRKRFFDFPLKIRHLAANLRTPINKLCFLLSCGYFKASKRFLITQDMIMLLDKWRHTGFNVFFGPRILPRQEESMASGS
jgi:hypothetical protein